jgi:mannose-6-phosphate isomerase
MELLVPHVQHYDWGSETAIPSILGMEPDGRPWAELWIGDHPRLPSTVASSGRPLDADLPFLLKILAAARPLSIQSHPSLDQAIAGFASENAEGVAIDARERTYRDANHKPELICALTPFDALVGFREPLHIAESLGHIASAAPMLERLAEPDPAIALRTTVEWILQLSGDKASALIDEVAATNEVAALLSQFHPGDPGVLVAVLLHRVHLEPGEAVFLEAGNLHAYLSGVGVELMANSDNVIRGGLTSKHIDIEALLDVVVFESREPEVQRAEGAVHTFDTAGSGFGLVRVEASVGLLVEPAGPEIVLVTSGDVELHGADGSHLQLGPGAAGFIDGGTGYTISGDGVAWRATVGG